MDMSMHGEQRLEAVDQPENRPKPSVSGVDRLGQTKRRRVRDQDVELASILGATEARPDLQLQSAPSHLTLRVLVRARAVADAATESGDAQAEHVDQPTVDVETAFGTRPGCSDCAQRRPGRVRRL